MGKLVLFHLTYTEVFFDPSISGKTAYLVGEEGDSYSNHFLHSLLSGWQRRRELIDFICYWVFTQRVSRTDFWLHVVYKSSMTKDFKTDHVVQGEPHIPVINGGTWGPHSRKSIGNWGYFTLLTGVTVFHPIYNW